MLGVGFGDDVEYRHIVGPERGKNSIVPRYSIHVHSSWRLLKEKCIVLGQSDLFNRMVGELKLYRDDVETEIKVGKFDDTSRELNELLKTKNIIVTKIEANDLGDVKIFLEDDYCLEIFIDAAGVEESWRFFETGEDGKHFIVFDKE
jgi:hypothetical protein